MLRDICHGTVTGFNADDDAFVRSKYVFYFKIKIHLAQRSSSIQNNLSVNPADLVWYENRPLGVHKLGKMVKTISGGAKLSQIYTNHFVRASATTLPSGTNVSMSAARASFPSGSCTIQNFV